MLSKVVQCHRRRRIHIAQEPGSLTHALYRGAKDNAPAKPQLNWTTAKWAVLKAWLPPILARGIAVVPCGMGGDRVSQTLGMRPGILFSKAPLNYKFPPEIQTGPASAGAGPVPAEFGAVSRQLIS